MAYRERVDKRLRQKEEKYETEQLLKEKRSEEYEVLEEVFDKSTLMTIYEFLNKGVIDEIHGVVKAGKEARIYWGKDRDGKELAIKIYLTIAAEFKKGKLKYLEGDPRFKHMRRDTRSLVFAWALKEFKNLHLALKAKVRVPKPVAIRKNVLVMRFVGKDGNPAPELKELTPKNPEFIYNQLLEYIRRLYQRAELVHGDISEYNVMVWRGKPVLFDMAQAVLLSHPLATTFLKRDLQNLNRHFKKLGVDVLSTDEMYRKVTEHGET
ncbi:MAG: serine protein kinase RIO [Candidatus Bathyarchaeota archaeon]|nr:serine protein kinase RIO [Candidatus Bathyarchaeota archaeon]MDH5494298.1 serine protein kinase RIO [Candidatus Bathyarchaeota archaeon]